MLCGTGCCQVDIILHSPFAGLGMLNSLQMQLHVEEGRSSRQRFPNGLYRLCLYAKTGWSYSTACRGRNSLKLLMSSMLLMMPITA